MPRPEHADPQARLSGGVLVEARENHIALVTLNRAEARNAVDEAVTPGLARAVSALEEDPGVWAVILASAGGVFCAGADLKVVAAGRADNLRTEENGFAGFVYARRAKPWIAAVDGIALAGGLESRSLAT